MKMCIDCKQTLPLDDFHRRGTNGRQSRCKVCNINKVRAAYAKNRSTRIKYQKQYDAADEVKVRSRIKYIARTYGLADDEAEVLAKATVCEICGRDGLPMHIDHCHTTGRVRGVLCSNCNMSIGGFQESVESLKKAIWYLENK